MHGEYKPPAGKLAAAVVRRISGGGAMFVEPAGTITYSLYAPESLVAGMSYAESCRYLDDWVIGALTGDLGVSAWYQPLNDIASARGKIGGAAQTQLPRAEIIDALAGHFRRRYGCHDDTRARCPRHYRPVLRPGAAPAARNPRAPGATLGAEGGTR